MTLNATAGVVLGMIRLGHSSGYAIKTAVERSARFFWTVSYGQIYPELKRLEEAGLIEGSAKPAGTRPRTVYALTPAGEEALHAWLSSGDELTLELRNEGLLKLFFADFMEPAERVELVRAMRAQHEQVLATLQAIEPLVQASADAGGPRFPGVVLDGGLTLHGRFAEWCEELAVRLEEQEATTTRR